ncbi:uncharacterized protein K02A2.6 [Exaiptasia diaphana]|uniref:Integrase catalytic domain-containing protein n=1 Tax=Exaiptasia diaphana TaxID=2652724 RepID=A0A913XSJ1_EXADI|nr:uncharacterized protein K02A2.6 [Exaiptasia diaphana]
MSIITSEMIKKETAVNPVYSRVCQYTISGWPYVTDPSYFPFKSKQHELTVEQGCLLWGTRVVIPPYLQLQAVLNELQETHPGITKMKALARSYLWWLNIDKDIERTVQQGRVCQSMRSNPPEAPAHPWSYPTHPWSRIHIDFAGPVAGCMYLVVVHAYSKYPEIVKMTSITSQATVAVLREIFSRQRFPEMIVSDNGSQFTSEEFKKLCARNGVRHGTSAPYKPATNGQAERVVRVLKTDIQLANVTKGDTDIVIARYMLVYRNTPHTTTGESPGMLFMKRRLRTHLDLLSPSLRKHVEHKKSYTVDRTSQKSLRKFHVGDSVMTRNYARGDKWMHGIVIEVVGSRHYIVDLQGGNGRDIWIKSSCTTKEKVKILLNRNLQMPVSTSSGTSPTHMETNSATVSTTVSPEVQESTRSLQATPHTTNQIVQ